MGDLSDHFDVREAWCPCCALFIRNDDLIDRLERLRARLGMHGGGPVLVNSWCRCAKHNAAVGGVRNSRHLYGQAADIVVIGVCPDRVQDEAEIIFDDGGVGRYDTFTHVDVRGHKARWDMRSKKNG